MDLNFLWYFLIGVLLSGYAVLDGFDFGVGMLHIFARTDQERRVIMNSIGPVWDGNEVWLVTAGGALFAAFPFAYAAAFSGFYLPFMFLLFALIFRAVAIEFRGKKQWKPWRSFWDWAFFLASGLSALLFGVTVGNMILGLKIGQNMEFVGTLTDLLRPYPLLVGVFNISMLAMHGSMYLYMKTEGDFQKTVRGWAWRTLGAFVILYVFTTIVTLIKVPSATHNFEHYPAAWVIVVLNILAIANIPRSIHHEMPVQGFVSSACTILAMIFLFGFAIFPNLIVSSVDPKFNLTVYNAASSQKTLGVMTIIALIGIPFVVSYTSAVYYIFRGKVQITDHSY